MAFDISDSPGMELDFNIALLGIVVNLRLWGCPHGNQKVFLREVIDPPDASKTGPRKS
jgi:hypothetical protein